MEYYIHLIYSICIFITGLMFGSFFTLAIYRIPRKQDIVKTRSYCPNCKHKLGFFDCFPILSYVSTIGRCRYCQRPISIRYPLIEFASGLIFLIIYLIFGFSWQMFALIACYVYLFLVIGVDIMKSKMTDAEKKEIEQKKNKKAGAINVDILVAVIIFGIFFVSTIYATRNFSVTLIEYGRKSNAMNLCINNLNETKFKSIDELEEYTSSTAVIDEITYDYTIEVLPYKKSENEQVENAKVIVSTVSYMFDGNENSVSLKCVKVENGI